MLLLLLAETGFRIGELLGVRYVEDIDYQGCRIRVEPRVDNENEVRAKYEEDRWAKVSKDTFDILLFYYAKYRKLLRESEYLFITLSGEHAGQALTEDAVNAMLRRLQKKTQIKVTSHMLRRYFANERRKNGWSLELISQALGHRNLQTTINYLNINSIRETRIRLKYQEKRIYLGYHPDYNLAKEFYYCKDAEGIIWDFSIKTSQRLKYQIFTVLNYALENFSERKLRRGYLAPLHFFYVYCIDRGISDLTQLEQNQIDEYFSKAKEVPLVNNRYPQIVDKVQRILFLQAKDINWDANVWYLERFQFDITRYDPTRPVKRISFLDILDKHNREYLKMYVKYQLGVTGASVQNIWARTYITKAFLRFLDQKKLAVDKLTAAEIDLYMRELQKECVEIATFNDKVAEIHCFFRFLTARGYYSKVPFYSEYYIKREPVPHHYRSVPQNTVTEILQNLNQLPEDMRLMYLHLWCLGLRINEVCSIKREGYYLKEGVAWLRIYQHKMKMEKVIPIPMILYRSMMVYIERKKIGIDSYVFQNSKGGPFLSTHYWHEMVAWCKKQGIRCGDHVFQTHDYRHSVATALYERGASIQAIREFLGHKHENMTRRYIDCIQKHVDMSSEQYYKEQKSLVSEWRGSDKDGN